MKTKITTDVILSWGPCETYDFDKIEALRMSVCGRRKTITAADILAADIPGDDKLWVLLRPEFIEEKKLHAIAIFCWEKIARPIWEKYYPDDKRPHEAIRIKSLWLIGKATDEELAAARDAARAAAGAAAGDAARTAAWTAAGAAAWTAAGAAAGAAAWTAARAAAGAAAGAAAWTAAGAAAWTAAGAAAVSKILKYVKRQII